MKREIDRFQCKDESGEVFTVIILQAVIVSKTLDGPSTGLGTKDAILSDGRYVNFVGNEDDTFKIVDTGQIIKRI